MYGKVIINIEKTKENFGYDTNTLDPHSKKDVYCKCANCNVEFIRPFGCRNQKHQCSSVKGNQKHCFKCKTWKHIDLFAKDSSANHGLSKVCRECYNSYESVKEYNDKRRILQKNFFQNGNVFDYIRYRSYNLKAQAKLKGLDYNLDPEYLFNLWQKQEGRCFYSGVELTKLNLNSGFNWVAPSIDRINPDFGYVKDNVVWSAYGVNSFKNQLTVEQFKSILEKIKWWFTLEEPDYSI